MTHLDGGSTYKYKISLHIKSCRRAAASKLYMLIYTQLGLDRNPKPDAVYLLYGIYSHFNKAEEAVDLGLALP